MATMIYDAELERRLQAERTASGADRYDEVWEGVYMMTPMPNDEHQLIVNAFASILLPDEPRPTIEVTCRDTGQIWTV